MATDPAIEGSFQRLSDSSSTSEPEILGTQEEETPTASHALADASAKGNDDTREIGAAQADHGEIEVKDLGWNDHVKNLPVPLVGGLPNEELWTLIRRFDKQIFHVKSIEEPPLGTLDLTTAEEEEFSPEKLRAQLERCYMVVLVSLFGLWKHIVRLRSWGEYQRTSCFLAVYTVAWLLDFLLPSLAIFAIVLILSEESRTYCFPPAPAALIDSKTGGVQTPAAGVLGSEDSVTGAPEKHQGEAVEQEARNFVTSIATIVVSTAAGKQPQGDPDNDKPAPDPVELTEMVSDAKDQAVGTDPSHEQDRTKKPVSDAIWTKARPLMRLLTDFVDTWERFGNVLSATAPFHRHRPKLILASVFVPVLLGSYFTSPYAAMKGMGFGCGFGFFGQPVITRMVQFANRTYPRWQKYVELQNTILRGVPTNAQLTITLLRIGERNKAPIPPPPSTDAPPPVEAHATAGQDLDHLDATDSEIAAAVHPDPFPEDPEQDAEDDKKKHKKSHRLMALFRNTAKGGIHTALAADKAIAKAGAPHAKKRLGAVQGSGPDPETGPIRFPARCNGKTGHAYITATATTPALSWTPNTEDVKPAWTVTLGDIAELKKMGGLGWKSKILVGWAMNKKIVDGLTIITKDGTALDLTAVVMRDQLFNRLISMGSQMWESCRGSNVAAPSRPSSVFKNRRVLAHILTQPRHQLSVPPTAARNALDVGNEGKQKVQDGLARGNNEVTMTNSGARTTKQIRKGRGLRITGLPPPSLYHHIFTGSPTIPTAADVDAVAALNLGSLTTSEATIETGDTELPNPGLRAQATAVDIEDTSTSGLTRSSAQDEADDMQALADDPQPLDSTPVSASRPSRKRRRSPSPIPSVGNRTRLSDLQPARSSDPGDGGLAESTTRLAAVISRHISVMKEANSQSRQPPATKDMERAMRDGRDTFRLTGQQLVKFMKAMTQPWMATWWNLCGDDVVAKEILLGDIMGDEGR
ncbi:hypothetical protein AK830_g3395 [Neonectria ditissima]|uniref:Uncharacterized protein n=1 Tax=Neonectria ditissima TaxID=78410 RepID=A0A0P7BI50_9HYPO|nr:hypothetical protein AK830_g3395 [Neonectria ditissima]